MESEQYAVASDHTNYLATNTKVDVQQTNLAHHNMYIEPG